LYWFERIIRKMSGDPNWALPYWNWTSATERQLPVMFRDPTSDLYTVNRAPAMNSDAGSLPPSHVRYTTSFLLSNLFIAHSTSQRTPSGAVQVDVGGGAGWMSHTTTDGQDSIVYLHPANIERLWNLGLAQGGGRTDPLGSGAWRNQFHTFVGENGHFVTM